MTFVAIAYNFLLPPPSLHLVRACCVALLLVVGTLCFVQPPLGPMLLVTITVAQLLLFFVNNYASALSVASAVPLSRPRLLGTVMTQLFHLGVLFFPTLASPWALLALVALPIVAMVVSFQMISSNSSSSSSSSSSSVPSYSVALSASLIWIAVCAVGLNGEQILDASLKISLRASHVDGQRGPMAMHHAITALSRLLAFGSSSSSIPTRYLGLGWAAAQLLRLILLGAQADLSSHPLWIVASLIALDKYAGSMGEVALEAALLRRLSSFPRNGIVPALVLISCMQPLEDVTGSAVKLFVRAIRKAEPLSTLALIGSFKAGIIVALILFTVFFIWRWSQLTPQKRPSQPRL